MLTNDSCCKAQSRQNQTVEERKEVRRVERERIQSQRRNQTEEQREEVRRVDREWIQSQRTN